jgi:hypothetical protein
VQYYARLVEAKLGSKVEVKNLAQDGLSSDQLLASLQTEPTSTAVKDAEVVLLGIGGADREPGDLPDDDRARWSLYRRPARLQRAEWDGERLPKRLAEP